MEKKDGNPEVKMGKLQIHAEGRKYTTILTDKFKHRSVWKAPDPREVKSIIPGSVIEVYVKKGDTVQKGAPVMLYEAMKMHNVIVAPFSGTVSDVFVKVGEKLHKGVVMLMIEPDQTKEEQMPSDK